MMAQAFDAEHSASHIHHQENLLCLLIEAYKIDKLVIGIYFYKDMRRLHLRVHIADSSKELDKGEAGS